MRIKDSHATSAKTSVQLRDINKSLPLRVLSSEDWAHWQTMGYVVVRNAVPCANIERLVDLLWKFEEMDPHDVSTWARPQRRDHRMVELNDTGMVEIYNHQFLWDNRMEQRVYDAYVDVWDREDLWVAIDRANLNPPRKRSDVGEGFIHWDVDTSLRPLPIGVQGVLSLNPYNPDVGGFQCIPELFANFYEWESKQPASRDSMHPDISGLEVVNIDLQAGDLLIFNSLLAHGIRPNCSTNKVRMAQYVSMYPANPEDSVERSERIRMWKELDSPNREAFPGDPREWEKHHASPARLTDLGKRLLGLENWS